MNASSAPKIAVLYRLAGFVALLAAPALLACGNTHLCACGHETHDGSSTRLLDAGWMLPALLGALLAIRLPRSIGIPIILLALSLVAARMHGFGNLAVAPLLLALSLCTCLALRGKGPSPARLGLFLAVALAITTALHHYGPGRVDAREDIAPFLALRSDDDATRHHALCAIEARWAPGHTVMLLEAMPQIRNAKFLSYVFLALYEKTGQSLGPNNNDWFPWVWKQHADPHPQYAAFKSALHGDIDPRFKRYFETRTAPRIRLDEIRWGGVVQDGIPPLRDPTMMLAHEARYLDDSDVIFGIEINGDARAYPKRILAHHELFTDTVGDVPITGAYCTLCGSMIVYDSVHGGVHHDLGTSGFLYRSNKLMYDAATQSLWSTLRGEPVVGPLANSGIALSTHSVVTTTWGAWKARHFNTTVLSLETGHRRDYAEGAAYRDYFATDRLMFSVQTTDTRLRNKSEVLALRSGGEALAIDTQFLAAAPVYHARIGALEIVIITDASGASRVYRSEAHRMQSRTETGTVIDVDGAEWSVTESALTRGTVHLSRYPAHRAFWFGWHAAYPDTRLVK